MKFTVDTQSKSYQIHINEGFGELTPIMIHQGFSGMKAIIVSDSNVAPLYIGEVFEICKKVFSEVSTFTFEAGEQSKTLKTIDAMFDSFFEKGLDRKSVVIALGGGVTGDMAGFAASTYMRGIRYVQVPTTLLSQVDSSVGGKTGVDFKGAKNIIGSFYQPDFVYIATNTLRTLPEEQFISGMGEALKHGLIQDKDYFDWMYNNRKGIRELEKEDIAHLVAMSCKIKAGVVSKDEREGGLREILNFGHTFGHAIETLLDFTLPHGQCVSVGIVCSLYISLKRQMITADEFQHVVHVLKTFGLPVSLGEYKNKLETKKIYEMMHSDKKAVNNELSIVLLKKLGDAYRTKDVTEKEIFASLDYVLR